MDSLQREESGVKTEIVMKNYLVLNEVTGSNNTSDNSLLLSSYYVPDSYNALVMLTQPSQKLKVDTTFIPILQLKKLRHREVK